ncbi:MAG: FAD-binding oxidoreductase [Alphaproteobacteria bacterium]|nr:FAD-binding oxidoreductase [Alphaproteobacteria bacterium]
MKRRQFCQSAVVTGMVAGFPFSSVLAGTRTLADIPAVTFSGQKTALEKAAVKEFAEALKGDLLVRGDPGYNDARKIWNGIYDRQPALIARCADIDDVSKAVDFARERSLLSAVRGGGHSYFGRSACEDGLMIDLSGINGVEVDPKRRRARVGGGALLHDLDVASQAHGLATTTGVVSHIGVGGLTLGGGFGRLNRKFGMTIDNLLSADMVTADGKIRRVSAEENADLFWGIRGGGGNFGIVTAFEFMLHPAGPELLGGSVIWPISQARDVLEFWAEYATGLSDDLYVAPFMGPGGEDEKGIVGMDILYAGDPVAGEKELAPLRQFGKPAEDAVGMVDYIATQTALDASSAHGNRYHVKTGMVATYTQGLVDALVESFRPLPGYDLYFNTCGGAVSRVAEDATAWPHRRAETMIGISLGWRNAAEDEAKIATLEDWWSALEPLTSGYYNNLREESESKTVANYGPAYSRLVQLKNTYDPGNLFRLNANIKPTV